MLELLFSLLLQLSLLQGGLDKPVTDSKAASGKNATTITTNKASTPIATDPSIGSGGWDDKN
ncbi:MAG: hypothetical protein ACO1OF_17320 [Adhaeribacter sp.]